MRTNASRNLHSPSFRQSKEDYEKQKAKDEARSKEVQDAMKDSLAEKDRLVEARQQEDNLVQEVWPCLDRPNTASDHNSTHSFRR